MLLGSLLNWLDAHAGAITAIATIVLVVITAAYVVVTYLLVRDQRLQAQLPKVEYEYAAPGNQSQPIADLKLQNVGTGTATELTILAGPEKGVEMEMPALGERFTLLSGESRIWRLRPHPGGEGLPNGDLPLTMHYLDNNRTKAIFEVLVLRFERRADGWSALNLGSIQTDYSQRQLKRLARRQLRPWNRPGALWGLRKSHLSRLLLDPRVRAGIRAELRAVLEELLVLSDQIKAYRNTV